MRDDSPKFHLRLERKPYPDEVLLFEILKQNSGIEWSFESFQQYLYRQDRVNIPLYVWHFCTEKERGIIEQKFSEISVQLNVEQVDSPFLFPTGRISNSQNNWFSRQLILLNEDALDRWALANNCLEVYRVSLVSDEIHIMRINSDNVTIKKADLKEHLYYESWTPSSKTWDTIQQIMIEKNFWNDDTWNTLREGYLVLDGTTNIIEGYKDGNYKFLYDEGSAEDKARYVAQEFLNLRPDKP